MFLEHVSKPKTKQGARDEDRFPCRTEETQSKACTVKKRKRKKGKARKFPKPCCREKKKKRGDMLMSSIDTERGETCRRVTCI